MDESKRSPEVQRVFEEIKALLQVPFVPKIFQVLADDPKQLVAVWERLKKVMMTGDVDIRTKLVAAFSAALSTRNHYFVSAYRAALQRLGFTEPEVNEIKRVVDLTLELDQFSSSMRLRPDLEA